MIDDTESRERFLKLLWTVVAASAAAVATFITEQFLQKVKGESYTEPLVDDVDDDDDDDGIGIGI